MAERFRNIDYSDRELLAVIWSLGERDGATTDQIAAKLGISSNGHNRATRIAPRLAWMRKFGFIDRADIDGSITPDSPWVLTHAGEQLMAGKLSQAVQSALQRMDPGSQLLMMRTLSQRAYVEGSSETAYAIRREWDHQRAKRVYS